MSKTPPIAVFALHEARLGNHGPLIGRVLSGAPLTADERNYIAAALERRDGKRGRTALRQTEQARIRGDVESIKQEQGLKTEAAVAEVARLRGRRRSTIFAALNSKESKKP
jgi:hypothetical protein